MPPFTLTSFLIWIFLSFSSLAHPSGPTAKQLKITVLHEFPKGTFIENLNIRPCGSILVTSYTGAHLYQLSPSQPGPPILVHTFSNATGLAGITETLPDVFYVIAGSFNWTTFSAIPESYSMHRVDFTQNSQTPYISFVTSLSTLGEPNGLTNIPGTPYILIADSFYGLIYIFDTETSTLAIYLDHPLLKPTASIFKTGVNGIRISGDYLYFSNTGQDLLARVQLEGSMLKGSPEVVVTGTPDDDFAIDRHGNAFLAENGNNDLSFATIGSNGTSPVTPVVIAGGGNSTVFAGPTSAQFGRAGYERSLFVTSTGGIAGYLPQFFPGGSFKVGGRVSRVDFQSEW